jgi:DNA polymerase-1
MPLNGPDELLVLIDAHSLIYQVFHAIPEMSSPKGLPTNAIFGFARDLLFLRDEKRPTYLVVAFDLPTPVFRSTIYPEYKAHRKPMPDDLQLQIPEIHRLIDAFNIPRIAVDGFEADDVMATLAKAASARGSRALLCTSDKDCRQLLDDRVQIYNLRKKQTFGRDELQKDWGIAPEQVVDYQSLVGDSVDNVPGVPGVGDKTAAKLLQDFGTLDNLLANVDKVPGAKRQENLRAAGPIVALSRQLVRLDTDVPIPLEWDSWKLRAPDADALLALFQEWGFRGLADQVRKQFKTKSAQPELFPVGADDELFAFGANAKEPEAPAPVWEATYHLVDTPEKFAEFEKQLRQQRRIAVDLETTSLEPRRAEIVGVAVSWQKGEAWYLALRGPADTPLLDPQATLERLKPILEDPTVAKVNQNIKYDQIVLRQQGIALNGVAGDPMVADYLLHAGERSHSMADLAIRYLNHSVIPITDLIGKGKAQIPMDQVPTSQVAAYSGEDADVAWRLCDLLEPRLTEEKLRKLYDEVEIPLIHVLAELEFNGIRLDVPLLQRIGDDMARQIAGVEEEIHALAGRTFNIASPKQLRDVLFDEMKLPTQKKTGVTGEASTDQETLERLAALGHPIPRKILEHRQLSKLKGTYVDALPGLVNPATGRVHASFNQTVAATGRLSSSDPNLQNIPVRTEQGRQIRQAFVPEPGWTLLTADYSQVELRLLAHFCGDETLRRAFAEERDVHAAVASQIFGTPEDKITSEMRRTAKTVNFGVIYGISAFGLATRLGITKEEAAKFIDAYFKRYPKVLEYQARLLESCRKTGYVGTLLGRRRAISGIRPRTTYSQRNQPEREAINMEIQGSAADLMKQAMLGSWRRLQREKRRARLLLTVHDELVVEVPPEELHDVARLLREEMTSALPLSVPLRVDVAAGPNWLDVEDLAATAA